MSNINSYTVVEVREFEGRVFKARSNGAGACVFVRGGLGAVADSKSGRVLTVPADGLVAVARAAEGSAP